MIHRPARITVMTKLNPKAPFLELNFYFSHRNPRDLSDVILARLEMGMRLSGIAYVQRDGGIAHQPFDSIHTYKGEWEPVHVSTPVELVALRQNPDVRLVKVYLVPTPKTKGGPEIVTYPGGTSHPHSNDRAPIAIWSSGDVFSGIEKRGLEATARREGRKAYKRFVELVQRLDPDYGSITVEWSLETPTQLAHTPVTRSFANCYLNHAIVEGISIPPTMYVEELSNGVYVSSDPAFHPTGKSVTYQEYKEFSTKIAANIASLFRGG
jgi:hypothetical protein